MYRSGSTNRFSDDHFSYYGSSSPSSKVPTALRALSDDSGNELPMYEPLSEAAKKEKSRAKFAEKAVHAIPFVLLLCAFILWIFSNPDINLRGSSVAEGIQGMANKGDLASDDTGHLPLHLGDLPHTARDTNTIFSRNRS
ncbi:uncharacterized protein LOC130997274 [Salvia miltiorrhiza]|uniref:uncharacterized protein LOC130997274 n=1 Tax=Salvia miltiorrhiza TaxID=226208 RepID=UPI0025ACC9A3|nr:uncharacterized protein LOC130997274 [Salvia miltiorrhiza]